MNDNFTKLLQTNYSGLGCLVYSILIGLFLTSIGLGWLVNGLIVLFLLLLILPAIAALGLRWWLKRNLVEDSCPNCSYQFTGFNNTQCNCPNCGETVKVNGGKFDLLTPPGTIDVEAVEVSARVIED